MVESISAGEPKENLSDDSSEEKENRGSRKEMMKTLDLILCEVIEQRQ